jgi:glycosyltransferase involved in cell wall biosynthesis
MGLAGFTIGSGTKMLQNLRVAVIHEWLVTYAGAERVLEEILKIFPQAHVYTLIDHLPENKRHFLNNCEVKTSFIQSIIGSDRYYRHMLPLFPLAIEQLDMSSYDLIISSQYCVSHGVITGPKQLHISYAHSPVRYAWDLYHQYMEESGLKLSLKGWLAKFILHYIRMWDTNAALSVDAFMCNSNFVAKRIEKYYRREATVIYPPVDVEGFKLCENKEDFFLTASRMVPYKKIDLIVKAFSKMPDKKLVVIGEGPDYKKIKALATPNVILMGHTSFEILKSYMQRAKAFVFAAEEDFGIVPLEAQACGTPVIAYGKGGALETVKGIPHKNPTGLFFRQQTVEALIEAVESFEAYVHGFNPLDCRENALRFSQEVFRERFVEFIEQQLRDSQKSDLKIDHEVLPLMEKVIA